MKKLIVLVAFGALTLSSCGLGTPTMKQDIDTVAYFFGVDIGTQLKMMDSTMNPRLIAKGIIEVFEGKETVDRDSVGKYLTEYFQVRLPEKRKKEAEEFLASVERDNPNVQRTETGLLYEVIMPGDENLKPEENADRVRVFYTGTLKNGQQFDASTDTVDFRLNGVIKGWTEGLKLIGKGGKIRLWVPGDLAYGTYGRPPKIGPNEALVFDIDLLDVIPADTTRLNRE